MNDIKIAVYAIAADEPQIFIRRWLMSMAPATYICVLITKAGNKNYQEFINIATELGIREKLIIAEDDVKPWRFDVARNRSMSLIPDDADAYICTDIDEVLIPDFFEDYAAIVREHPDFHRVFYRYAWSHYDDGKEKWVFWYDKAHGKGYRWKFPVHETLCFCNEDRDKTYYLNQNKIYLHHYPDDTKSRGSYLGLLEKRAEEYPDDLYGLYYLTREYTFKNDYESAIKTGMLLYTRLREEKTVDDMMMLPMICNTIGDCMVSLGIKDDAEMWYQKGIRADIRVRYGYIKLAQLYAYQGRAADGLKVLCDMRENCVYIEDWRMQTWTWRKWKERQIEADCYCWLGDVDRAWGLICDGKSDIITDDDITDATYEGFYGDYDFIERRYYEVHRDVEADK